MQEDALGAIQYTVCVLLKSMELIQRLGNLVSQTPTSSLYA